MATLNYKEIVKSVAPIHEDNPEALITDHLSGDLGGTLARYLIHVEDITEAEFDIIVLKTYNYIKRGMV